MQQKSARLAKVCIAFFNSNIFIFFYKASKELLFTAAFHTKTKTYTALFTTTYKSNPKTKKIPKHLYPLVLD